MSTYLLRKGAISEDAVTGQLADLLRAFPTPELVRLLFMATTLFPSNEALPLGPYDVLEVEAWPTWTSGEPDLVLRLMQGDETVRVLVIEAKLGAAKSGEDAHDATGEQTVDQLAKYYREVVARWPSAVSTVVYLTHHASRPFAELAASRRAILRSRQNDAVTALAWCSWHDVETVLRQLAEMERERALVTLATDLANVLRAAGLHHFSGRWTPRAAPPPASRPQLWWSYGIARNGAGRYLWRPLGIDPPPKRERAYRWHRAVNLTRLTDIYKRTA